MLLETGQTHKDIALRDKMFKLNKDLEILELQKAKHENDKEELLSLLEKEKATVEKEMRLRLNFEAKVNNLFKMNNETHSKNMLLKQRNKIQKAVIEELESDNEKLNTELL
jgi:hypothetical protein